MTGASSVAPHGEPNCRTWKLAAGTTDAARAVWMREKGKRNATACERGWSLVSEVAVSVLEPGVAKPSSSVAIAASTSHYHPAHITQSWRLFRRKI